MNIRGVLFSLLLMAGIVISAGCIANPLASNSSGKNPQSSIHTLLETPSLPDQYTASAPGSPRVGTAGPATPGQTVRLPPAVAGQNTTINGTGLEATANSTDSITVNGTVITVPVAQFSSDVILGYSPLVVRFTDTSLNLPVSWTWDFGDGGSSSLQDPVHTFHNGGQFSVTLMATNLAGTGNFTSNISVFEPGFTAAPNSGKAPFTVTFTDTGTGYPQPTAWYWDFGDSGTRSLRNTTHQYTIPGTYDVNLRVTGPAGTAWVNRSAAVTIT